MRGSSVPNFNDKRSTKYIQSTVTARPIGATAKSAAMPYF